ncbi:MAG: nucleotidyltransferase domain-containing protein [Candidatus Woesearchaeota archaeon]
MSQKNYIIKIIEVLLNGKKHLRQIAKEIKTNQTTTARKLQDLYKENVVDFEYAGKNKVFFLKKTFEAKQYCLIMEQYKTLDSIKKYPVLRNIFEKIRKNEKISMALIFGSYAKQTSTKESDIDIYIETLDKEIKKEIESINSRISVKIGNYEKENLLIKEIEKNHIIIKGGEEFYEKNSFFA